MSPRKPASEELTKEMIIQKARIEFVNNGFQSVSMRSIAKQLGCSHSAIYYHFKNKAELFYTIIETDFSKLNDLIENTIQGSEDDQTKLYMLFLRYIEFGLNHQSQYEIMFIVRNTEVDSLSHEACNLCYQKFAHVVQSLTRKNLPIIKIWSAFLSLHGFVSHYRGNVDSYKDAELAAKSHVDFIVSGLNS